MVNNKRVKEALLKDGDEIQTGEVILKFFQEDFDTVGSKSDKSISNKEKASDFYSRVYKECEVFFSQNTEQFLNRQISAHLGKTPQTIVYADKQELAKWIHISGSLFLNNVQIKELADRVMALKDN